MARRSALIALVVGLVGLVPPALAHESPAPGHRGEVAPAEDDPDGCTTAASEAEDGCGARGREHFGSADHVAPVEACADRPTEGGGAITRILPDGPRHDDGSLAFISGACVYLPPGYGRAGTRFPVVYLLHGGGGDQGNWVVMGGVESIMDAAATDGAARAIVVMPDGRSGQWYDYEDGSFLIERYVLDHLVPYVDQHFSTIASRDGRAIVGLSNGGYGAMHLAAKRPDLFIAAGGMSSNLGARGMSGLGDTNAVHYQGSVPYQLAANLDEVDLILDLGTSCESDVSVDLCATLAVDLAFLPDNRVFRDRLAEVGHAGTLDYRETEGSHAWRWWSRWFAERQLPFVLERLTDPTTRPDTGSTTAIPDGFRYRSIAAHFEIWDHEIRVDRPVREFLELADVTRDGLTLVGSGQATVTTPGRYPPGGSFVVAGATDADQPVVADSAGRLTFTVDLGPSAAQDQFSTGSQVEEETGDRFATRDVTIAASKGRSTSADPVADEPAATPSDLAAGPGRQTPARQLTSAGASTPQSPVARTVDLAGDAVAPSESTQLAAPAVLAARNTDVERTAELIPTLLFLALLATPASWWLRRRRAATILPDRSAS